MRALRCVVFTGIFVAGLSLGTSAAAATITYANFTDWQAAVTGITTTTFEENDSGVFTYYGYPGAATFDGVNYSSDGDIYTVDPDYYPDFYAAFGTGDVLSAQIGTSLVINTFSATALAFNFNSLILEPVPLSITLSTGDVFGPFSVDPSDSGFFGVTSTTPITGVTMSFGFADHVNIDNFSLARANETAPVPEPTSMLLLGTGLAGIGARRWRQRKRA